MPAPNPTDRPPEPETVPMLMVPVELLERCLRDLTYLVAVAPNEIVKLRVEQSITEIKDALVSQ